MFDEDITNSACRFVCLVHCLFWTTGQTDGLSNSSALYVLCYSAQEYTRRGVVLKESSICDSKTEFALALYVLCIPEFMICSLFSLTSTIVSVSCFVIQGNETKRGDKKYFFGLQKLRVH